MMGKRRFEARMLSGAVAFGYTVPIPHFTFLQVHTKTEATILLYLMGKEKREIRRSKGWSFIILCLHATLT
jgi:hypothetical protein